MIKVNRILNYLRYYWIHLKKYGKKKNYINIVNHFV